MSGEQLSDLHEFLNEFNKERVEYVRLHLVEPKYNSNKLTFCDLFQIQEKFPPLKKFMSNQRSLIDDESMILCFQGVQDVVDFQHEFKDILTYALAYIQSDLDDQFQKNSTKLYSPQKLEKQLDEQGFFIKNGQVLMKRTTSFDQMICENNHEQEKQEQSTMMQTQRHIHVASLEECKIQETKVYEEEIYEVQEKYECQVIVKDKIDFKPIVDGILLTGLLYGGLKLLKYFVRA